MGNKKKYAVISLLLANLPSAVSATTMSDMVCRILGPIWQTLFAAGGTLVIIMFLYGGIKYVFAASDPGGRKEAKNTCIHALIAGMLLVVTGLVVRLLGPGVVGHICPGLVF